MSKKLSAKAARQLRQCADELADLGAASSTEAAPCPECESRKRVHDLFERKWNKDAPETVSVDEIMAAKEGPAQAAASLPRQASPEGGDGREAFERWVLATHEQTQPFGLVERSGDGYLDGTTQKEWRGWQAALRQSAAPSGGAALLETLSEMRCVADALYMNLKDTAIWNPQNFRTAGLAQLFKRFKDAAKKSVELEAALAQESQTGAAPELRKVRTEPGSGRPASATGGASAPYDPTVSPASEETGAAPSPSPLRNPQGGGNHGDRHIGWVAGHCSDPMNCPVCKSEGDKPR